MPRPAISNPEAPARCSMVLSSETNEKIDLSIVVVNYNTQRLLLQYLQSVCETVTDLTIEIIVVDNASSDSSVEAVKT
jgi:hypothetical protein